ncbi:Predicted Fe-Mo cluster-binding protein, NifX family [Syntrophus gentianae]|uniref:Predicted Fe-Mo cluster-binding protein, NifX family n=1 Tax=Syntrophus gentianae TaxID=43775 RepID=A0A1H7UY25_9BACT|nr:NifB/NifX family molybdenum-iron cluster-binding protein [Syntrophus gentianae]SEM01417.1 Predicted Fe-Mo cluster-binding protein, NifX family [Syntrophus gentianae]
MKVCFAVLKDEGVESAVYNHFGSAPAFVMVDTETSGAETIQNQDKNHIHGACNPVMALGGRNVDAVVVGGIGAGALRKLNAEGIVVYGSLARTVKENLELLSEGRLPQLSVQHACQGHAGGCGHH